MYYIYIFIIMYSNYLLIGVYGVSGGLIYNAIENLFLQANVYEGKKSIFNYGMFMGIALGAGQYYIENSEKLLKISE